MTTEEVSPFVINKAVFDHLAGLEGQVFDGYEIHSVDREAGTLMFGGTKFQSIRTLPRFSAMDLVFTDECFPDPIQPVVETAQPRGAQWKRENNRHRRSW